MAPILGEKDENGNVTRYAFAGVPATYELGAFIGAQKGLSYMVDEENGHTGTPRNVLFEKEGTFAAFLEKWKKLYDTGYLNNITSGVSTEFAAGRTASMLASSSNLSTVMNTVGGRFEVGTAFVPKNVIGNGFSRQKAGGGSRCTEEKRLLSYNFLTLNN